VHVFANEARTLLDAIPGSHAVIAYSKPGPADRLGKDFDIEGRLDSAALEKLKIPAGADYYLCGPAGFLSSMRRCLTSLGIARDAIHQETFGPTDSVEPGVVKGMVKAEARSPHPPLRSPGSGPIVSFTRSGLAVPWDNGFSSLLEFAEACDIPVKWSCRTGVCHMCECGFLGGKLHYSPEPLDQPATGNALICCSTPESEVDLDL